MKDIKVIFRGNKAPSGKTPGVAYLVGQARLDSWSKDGRFDMEVEKPKAKPKSKKKTKKEKE